MIARRPKSTAEAVACAFIAVAPVLAAMALAAPPLLAASLAARDDLGRMRAHLRALTQLGPRPSGSAANARAVEYLSDRLRVFGYQVRIAEGEGRDPESGTAGSVRNVIGWLPSTTPHSSGGRDALLLASHFDSVVDGPGGTDNAASVAALLVAAEDLGRARARLRPVIVFFSDAEERYLLGSEQFVREDPLASRVGGVINFDHAGRAGPLFNFEAAPGSSAMQEALWSMPSFPDAPRSFSFATDIYRVLPFDTDFTRLSVLGSPGLNFGLARDGYAYHTGRDREEQVTDRALLAIRRTASGLADRFVIRGSPLAAAGAADYAAFFPFGDYVVHLTRPALWIWSGVAALLSFMALALVTIRDHRGLARGLAAVVLPALLTPPILVAVMVGLRSAKGVDQVAYASPWPLFLLLGGLAFLVSITVATRLGMFRMPLATRLGAALIPWALLAPLAVLQAPASSAFFFVPAVGIALAALLSLRSRRPAAGVAAGLIAVGSVVLVWTEPLGAVLPFLVTTLPKMGPEPLFFWPGLISLVALSLTPLSWAFSGSGRSTRQTMAAFGLIAVGGAAGVLAQAPYDETHPQRVWGYHVTTRDTSYQVLASTDRLSEPGATLEPGPEARELPWLTSGWSRVVMPARVRSPQPRVSVGRDGGGWLVDVLPPPGTDLVTLTIEQASIARDPGAAEPRRRTVLRRVAAGRDSVRFAVAESVSKDTPLRVMCTSPVGPDSAALAEWKSPSRTLSARGISILEVVLR